MNRLGNELLTLLEMALRRARASLGSSLAIAFGVLIATTTICSLLLYAESVNILSLRDRLQQAHEQATFDLIVRGESALLDRQVYSDLDDYILTQMQDVVGLPITRSGRHVWSKSLILIPPGSSPVGRRDVLPRTRFQSYSNLRDLVRVLEGAYPQITRSPDDVLEVMVTQKLANKLNIQVGQEFAVEDFKGGAQSVTIRCRLAGIIALKDEQAAAHLYAPWFLDEVLTIPEESFFNTVALSVVPLKAELTWAANYDEQAIGVGSVDAALVGLTQLDFKLRGRLETLQLLTSMEQLLNEYKTNILLFKALLLLLGAPVLAIALYYITMSADLLVEYQRSEIAVFKSRGSSTAQVLGLFLVQGLVLILPAVIASPFLAIPMANVIGKAETFMVFTNPRVLPIQFRGELFLYAGLTGLLALLAIFLPAMRAAGATVVTYRQNTAREKRSSFIHRYYIDFLLLVLGGVGYRILSGNKTIITRSASGGLQFDPLLLVTPIVLAAALGFIILRLVPLLFKFFARLAAFSEMVAGLFALRQIARTTTRYNGLILILTFTLALGLFTTSVANAFDRNYLDQAMFAAGADLRAREFDLTSATWTVRSYAEYLKMPGVTAASPVRRVGLVGRQATVIAKGELLAVDPQTLGNVAWWRKDFSPDLETILAQLKTNPLGLVANAQFINRHGLEVGEKFDIDIDGVRVDFILVGSLGDFPTLFPADGDRLVVRLDYLQETLGDKDEPNEVWLSTRPGLHNQVIDTIKRTAAGKVGVYTIDGHQLSGVRRDDPLRTGLFGALSLGFLASSVLSILGFLLYAFMSIQSRSLQFGVLRATGLSVNQLIRALSGEQLSLIGIGIFVGTLLGGGAGWMFTRFLQLSIIAREAVPSFLVAIPWTAILELYLILVVIFGLALGVSVTLLRRMRIASVLRLGEQ